MATTDPHETPDLDESPHSNETVETDVRVEKVEKVEKVETTAGTPRAPVDFGDVLPEQTRDDAADPWSGGEVDDDERLLREVPPHHG